MAVVIFLRVSGRLSARVQPSSLRTLFLSPLCAALALFFLYSRGDMPISFWKLRLNDDMEGRPTAAAIFTIESLPMESIMHAFLILSWLRYFSGEVPMVSWNERRKWAGLIRHSSAIWSMLKSPL